MENMNSQLIYYVSKKFSLVENKYIEIQKYLFAVIMVARMLRLYVLLHPQNDGPNRKTTQILPTKVRFFRNNGKAKDRTQWIQNQIRIKSYNMWAHEINNRHHVQSDQQWSRIWIHDH